jgi:4a-hydroxytetrahydrobiopterin dehydratase
MVVNTVGHLAEAAWHTRSHGVLRVCDRQTGNTQPKNITDNDFALAADRVVQWQPGKEGGPLENANEDAVQVHQVRLIRRYHCPSPS